MRYLLLAATALAMLAGPVLAQSTSGSASNPIGSGAASSASNSNAISSTKSSSVATASPTLTSRSSLTANPTVTTDVYVANGGTSGGSGTASGSDPTINYSGGYTVRNTPEVIPPSVAGGNTCAVGASGGISLSGFGFAAGGTWADRECERRQEAALLFNMGRKKPAYEMMCQDDNVRAAMKAAGEPCSADLAPAKVSQAPGGATAAAAAPANRPPVIVSVSAGPAARGGRAG